MKQLRNLALSACLLFGVASANAITTYTDFDSLEIDLVPDDVWDSAQGSYVNPAQRTDRYVGLFDLTIAGQDGDLLDAVGYDPTLENLVSAFATFEVAPFNLNQASTRVTINLGQGANLTKLIQGGLATDVFLEGDVIGNAFFDLAADGRLRYVVVALGHSVIDPTAPNQNPNSIRDGFTLVSAFLTADAAERNPNNNVPDSGATAVLLGLGFLGLQPLRRIFRR